MNPIRSTALDLPVVRSIRGHTLTWSTLLVFAAVVLPAGALAGFNVKVALSIIAFCMIVLRVLQTRTLPRWLLLVTLCTATPLLVGWAVARLNNVPVFSTISELNAIASVFIVAVFPIYAAGQFGRAGFQRLLSSVFWAFQLFAVIKIAIAVTVSLDIVPVQSVIAWFLRIFGQAFIYLDVGYFTRVFFPSDFLAAPLLFAALTLRAHELPMSRRRRIIAIVLFGVSTLIAYSRFLWIFVFFAITLAAIVNFLRVYDSDRLGARNFYFGVILTTSALVVVFTSPLVDLVWERYTGLWAASSDLTRVHIGSTLWPLVLDRPLFGSGLGAFGAYIRFEEAPWNYELQWLALLMHFGLIGIAPFVMLALYGIIKLLSYRAVYDAAVALLVCAWLSVGFVNSFLLTSSAGAVVLSLCLLRLVRDENSHHRPPLRDG